MKKFNAFDRVLIRPTDNHVWVADFYDRYDRMFNNHVVISGATVEDTNILPYNEETKYLHGTVGEFTKWEPKKGEAILVKDYCDKTWAIRIFLAMQNNRYVCTSSLENDYINTTVAWDQAKPYINPFKE